MHKKLLTLACLVPLLAGCGSTLSSTEVQTKMEKFLTDVMLKPGTKFTIKSTVEEHGIYKMTLDVEGQAIDAYVSEDGELFFPNPPVNVAEAYKESTGETDTTKTEPAATVTPSEKPVVELFVMSHCPYGTQIEKGIIPVVEALGDSIDFSVKFCDYAMHGEPELKEQLNQYCIQKNNPTKYLTYLGCFLESGDGEACAKSTGVTSGLEACAAETDETYSVMSDFAAKKNFHGRYANFGLYAEENTAYGVQGSPTLIINGTEVSSGRDSQSLLNSICSAFTTKPEACSQTLSSESPAPGFGSASGSGASDSGSCN